MENYEKEFIISNSITNVGNDLRGSIQNVA